MKKLSDLAGLRDRAVRVAHAAGIPLDSPELSVMLVTRLLVKAIQAYEDGLRADLQSFNRRFTSDWCQKESPRDRFAHCFEQFIGGNLGRLSCPRRHRAAAPRPYRVGTVAAGGAMRRRRRREPGSVSLHPLSHPQRADIHRHSRFGVVRARIQGMATSVLPVLPVPVAGLRPGGIRRAETDIPGVHPANR